MNVMQEKLIDEEHMSRHHDRTIQVMTVSAPLQRNPECRPYWDVIRVSKSEPVKAEGRNCRPSYLAFVFS